MHTGCADGTTIIVEDLFYNVPARKKFLKSDKAEAGTITATVEKIALSKPNVSFRYIVDGETKFVTGGDGELSNAIYAILGRDFAKKTIKVERNEGGIKVEGYISTPELVRANRNLESFYINSRFVKSKTMGAALEQAYQSYIPSDKFPFCVLNLEINPSLVDVNVHPAKLEVKFSNENLIFSAVYYAVRGALSTSIARPELYEEQKKDTTPVSQAQFPIYDREAPKNEKVMFDSNSNFGVLKQSSKLDYSAYDNRYNTDGSKQFGAYTVKNEEKKDEAPVTLEDVCEKPQIESDKKEEFVQKPRFIEVAEKEEKIIVPDYKIIGEAFNSYVIVELGESIYLIDKHAAHERIIFEDLKKKTKMATPSSQMLMVPVEVYLTSDEMGALSEWEGEIKSVGFSFEIKNNGISVYEIPSEIEVNATADTLVAFLSRLKNGQGDAKTSREELFERALYQASCKAAIKAGRIYDSAHIKWICDRVLTLDNIKYCPHGRPICISLSKKQLEKQFKRS
jgi:DNA mismatch repair protein MutL